VDSDDLEEPVAMQERVVHRKAQRSIVDECHEAVAALDNVRGLVWVAVAAEDETI
jgi:hypothetical protein